MSADPGAAQARAQRVLDRLVESGDEVGLQAAVYWRGRLVVDAVAGVSDPATGTPVGHDTLFHTFSAGKGVTATVAHVLAERGLVDYDAPICEYWPEFGKHGKHTATVRHILTHSAGVPQLPAGVTPADLGDWAGMCDRIADLRPLWKPGTETGYHGWTYGWIVGEVVRRVTGQPISTVLRDVVAAPLGVTGSLLLGVPADLVPRVATLVEGGWADSLRSIPDGAPFLLAAPRAVLAVADLGNRPDYLRADIPSAGTTTARAAARMFAALIGEVDGVRLIPADRAALVSTPLTTGTDRILGTAIPKSLGYFPQLVWAGGSPASFGSTGAGGSIAFADPPHDLAFALTKNRLTAGPSAARPIVDEVYDALGLTREIVSK